VFPYLATQLISVRLNGHGVNPQSGDSFKNTECAKYSLQAWKTRPFLIEDDNAFLIGKGIFLFDTAQVLKFPNYSF
jgi:hypothetical protein